MIKQLHKYMAAAQPVELIYLDRYGQTSQRMVRLLEMKNDHVKAYCMTRRAPRYFVIENILAINPVTHTSKGA
ncbi:WYL domain-containing protein [Brevibacillus migulae]|uniref:WYL domain-containing protein n=1 Tax=Brevibacillus migulae TaxID=1644114 RepID=UPI00106EC7A8|nr:WYL domain-containing protein [Brevibacillus migulae]